MIICAKYGSNLSWNIEATEQTKGSKAYRTESWPSIPNTFRKARYHSDNNNIYDCNIVDDGNTMMCYYYL